MTEFAFDAARSRQRAQAQEQIAECAFAAATQDPGIRTSDTLRVSIETEKQRATILHDLRTDRSVAIVAASSRPTQGVIETSASTL